MEYLINNFNDFLKKPLELYKYLYNGNTNNNIKYYKFFNLDFPENYDIKVISDIHADYSRFIDFLTVSDFITHELKWNPKATFKILVICGDFIDGFRNRDNKNLGEHNEVSILQLIYNLRLQALKYKSYIFCTLGNHDYFSIHAFDDLNHLYLEYVDTNSINYYLDNFPIKNLDINDEELLCFSRAFHLSRFFLIGYPFFLKINDTIFAHAGFHKDKLIFEQFAKNAIDSNNISPMLFHRTILEKLASIDTYSDFFKTQKVEFTYKKFYSYIIDDLNKSNMYLRNNVLTNIYKLRDISENSILYNFLLKRELRYMCKELDFILDTYNCNLLVVGHCPTCTFTKNSCDHAKINFSCNNKLATVDIAFSSAFSPNKKFLECLNIYYKNSKKHMKIIRYSLEDKSKLEYDNLILKYNKWNVNSIQ